MNEKPSINIGTEDDPLWWSEGICEDCMNEDGVGRCACGCFVCADCGAEHAEEGWHHDGPREEILASPEAMARRAIAGLKEKQAERDALILELEQIAALQALDIARHDIVKQRKITRYEAGKLVPTGEADIIMRDGTKHVVPDHLLRWRATK